jgi:hypothetical protein
MQFFGVWLACYTDSSMRGSNQKVCYSNDQAKAMQEARKLRLAILKLFLKLWIHSWQLRGLSAVLARVYNCIMRTAINIVYVQCMLGHTNGNIIFKS